MQTILWVSQRLQSISKKLLIYTRIIAISGNLYWICLSQIFQCSKTHSTDLLQIVDEYKYLGILYVRSGFLPKSKASINKVMHCFIKQSNVLSLHIDMQTDLFNKPTKPVLLYGCEIWGLRKYWLKYSLGLKSRPPNCMVCGETDVKHMPVDIESSYIKMS